MHDLEYLPYSIDLWSEDELSIERDLARVADLSIARMAFDAAAVSYPRRMLTMRGPGAFEVRSAETSVETAVGRRARVGGMLFQ